MKTSTAAPTAASLALALAVVATACWLFSYSWMLAIIIPMDALVAMPVSPWLLAELAAVALGIAGVVVALVARRRSGAGGRATVALWLAAVVTVLTVASLVGFLVA